MAERIDNLESARRAIYPWGEWMDGSAWSIRRGEDFEVPAPVMAQHIRNTGRAKGIPATARLTPDGEGVEFQFETEMVA